MKDIKSMELKYLKAINEINHAIGTELELQSVCDLVVEKISKIINCEACAILLIEKDKIAIPSEVGFRKALGDVEFTPESPAIKYIIDTRNSIVTGNLKKTDFVSCVPEGCSMTSLMCEPIISNSEVRGIIHLDSRVENAFSAEDMDFVKILAGEISIAITRSLYYEEMKMMSTVDKLTGTFNRRKFDDDLEDEINKAIRYDRAIAVLMIDIDHFKNYNDFHGHPRGDDLLSSLGTLFMNNLRKVDRVYRYGGEEFTVICSETDLEGAFNLANRLCKIIEGEEFFKEGKSQPGGKITISIGCASFPENATNKAELVKKADDALYRAKSEGRNRAVKTD